MYALTIIGGLVVAALFIAGALSLARRALETSNSTATKGNKRK